MAKALGRKVPTDFSHVEKYPLTAERIEALTTPRPMAIGINWYPEFDNPEQDSQGNWWIARDGRISRRPRGGHCVSLKERHASDLASWWDFYNQVAEGICVGEGTSRTASHFNRKMYQPAWLYAECKKRDGYPNEEGTFVSVGMDVLREQGHVPRKRGERHYFYSDFQNGLDLSDRVQKSEGIAANRWATSTDDVLSVLGYGGLDYVDVENSWGRDYPHLVRMPASVLEILRQQDGEFAIPTDV